MLLLHQSGSVKVGEIIRYTITYTPSNDRILPTPDHLHLKVKNTCAIPLRAAWIHGPYALHVSAYPSTFNPHHKLEDFEHGVPQYEPMLKAGGSWTAKLRIPDEIRETGADLGASKSGSVTWIIEVASQILFSTSASVEFEVFLGRDERSLDLGFAAVAGHGHGGPGRLQDVEVKKVHSTKRSHRQTAGVYSKAVRLTVEDTEALWDKPQLPEWPEGEKKGKQKKIHLVVVTHGLHSNTGADLLFLKESIDGTVRAAREEKHNPNSHESATAPLTGGQEDSPEDDEEQTIVRGFNGNAVKTENGIQYLGKRLAKHILKMTFPDQPSMPVKKSLSRSFTDNFRTQAQKADRDGKPSHLRSSVHFRDEHEERAYKFTSISFIGHSLGGLVQTYAIAYIYKHSPTFFDKIEPINFITMAAPMLGLSNENPMYVKFALDFGLVGRTGQDLGLTWRPPTLARGGWNAMLSGLGAASHKEHKEENPAAKPLLRVLPTGPAHHVLRMFRNRTLYSNVVNDGIVPLRTSCLLFLDWRGLGKVEKARRENGLIGTVAEWGWAELTGANMSTASPTVQRTSTPEENDEHVQRGEGETVPQPDQDETTNDMKKLTNRLSFHDEDATPPPKPQEKGMLDSFLSFIRGSPPSSTCESRSHSPTGRSHRKQIKTLKRAQTVHPGEDELPEDIADGMEGTTANPVIRPHLHAQHSGQISRRTASKGDGFDDTHSPELMAPPKTSIFESAGDILHPPLPNREWITDPSVRARTIFHDRVYHPEDIPPPAVRRPTRGSSISDDITGNAQPVDGGMRIEEKIARAYHRDLSWRKVLVRLEPDAHNNMIVRRMFANAYGWPVVKHLCDTHFANTYTAQTRDEDEPAKERAPPLDHPVAENGGEEVKGQTDTRSPPRTSEDMREARDELTALKSSSSTSRLTRQESVVWDDALLEGSDDDNSDIDERGFMQRLINPNTPRKQSAAAHLPSSSHSNRSETSYVDGHRGLPPVSPRAASSSVTPAKVPAVHLTGGPLSPLLTNDQVEAPQEALQGGIAHVGLRRSLEEQVARTSREIERGSQAGPAPVRDV